MERANARQISQTLYQVTYPGHADCDRDVPYSYLRRLAETHIVEIEASAYGPRVRVQADGPAVEVGTE